MARRRRRWIAVASRLDPNRLVFIDETWIKTDMAPIRGWEWRGARLTGFKPDGRWRTLTFLAALRVDALIEPCVIDGPINGQLFREYVAKFLVRCLRPGDIVILDNLGSHRSRAVRDSIVDAGARLAFLPAYSPDLNPIEQVFAKVKHWMRMAQARSRDATGGSRWGERGLRLTERGAGGAGLVRVQVLDRRGAINETGRPGTEADRRSCERLRRGHW